MSHVISCRFHMLPLLHLTCCFLCISPAFRVSPVIFCMSHLLFPVSHIAFLASLTVSFLCISPTVSCVSHLLFPVFLCPVCFICCFLYFCVLCVSSAVSCISMSCVSHLLFPVFLCPVRLTCCFLCLTCCRNSFSKQLSEYSVSWKWHTQQYCGQH